MSKADRPDHPRAAERFNEDQATYTVRGAGKPDLEAGVAAIRAVWKTLPSRPGVYRMQDARGDVLYVGKARTLKSRVTSYTQVARLPKRLQRMVAQTRSMTIVTTRTEAEALLLEAQLIKRFRPPYNVLLRDDKSFPFILLREDHAFPRIQKHRGARRIKGEYYGPFASAGSVTRTLNALQKLFLLRSCSDSYFENRSRPCLLYQIKRCSAPCVGRIEPREYDELVAEAKEFLGGKSTGVQTRLSKLMAQAADRQDFELAAVYRDRLRALTYIQGSQSVHAESLGDADVFALACKAGAVSIQAFFIRGGQNWGHRAFFPAHTNDVPEAEVLSSFLVQFYEDLPAPRRILVDRDLADRALIEEALCERVGHKVSIEQPRRGARRKLIDQATRNAEEALDRHLAESATQTKILRELAETFELPDVPKRIEVYDNSHIMGTNATGAMIVAGPDGFRKNSYRKFNIKRPETRPGDDFAMMREVLERRFARLEKEDPDRTERRMARPAVYRRRQRPAVGGVRSSGGCGSPRRACGRDIQGPRPRCRPRDLPFARRARADSATQLGPSILPSAAARRSAPLRHRHASGQAREEPDHLDPRRGPGHRAQPQAGVADALRHRARGQGRGARGPREGARN